MVLSIGRMTLVLSMEPSLEELLKSPNLTEDDIGGISVAKEEVDVLKEGIKWIALMHILSSKSFIAASLKKTMQYAWATT
jgi:hypothetical protein